MAKKDENTEEKIVKPSDSLEPVFYEISARENVKIPFWSYLKIWGLFK